MLIELTCSIERLEIPENFSRVSPLLNYGMAKWVFDSAIRPLFDVILSAPYFQVSGFDETFNVEPALHGKYEAEPTGLKLGVVIKELVKVSGEIFR